ncbi:MAG: hypothetical protein ACE5OZ_15860 [Candidatus Heimdallarchaeota archaeon]
MVATSFSFKRRKGFFILVLLCFQMSAVLFSLGTVQSDGIGDQTSNLLLGQHEGKSSLSESYMQDYYSSSQNKMTGKHSSPGSSQENSLPAEKSPRSDESLSRHLERGKHRQPSPMDLLGSQDYVDNINDDHGPADIGSISSLAPMQSVGPVATLTEADIAPNIEDHYDQENSDVDSSPDIGTQASPRRANDSVNIDFMNLEEGNQGGLGTTYFIQPQDSNDTGGKWDFEGNAYDGLNSTFTNETSGTPKVESDLSWKDWNNTGSGTILQVDIRLYLDLAWLNNDNVTIEVWVGALQCPETITIDASNDGTGIEISLNDITEPGDGSWSWTDIGNIEVWQNGTKESSPDAITYYAVFEVWGWVYTGIPDYELDFEYSWTAADFDEPNENVSIYVQTAVQDSENLKAWERTGSTWSLLGSLSLDGWNNFSVSSLTSPSFTIKLNDSNQAGDAIRNDWKIDLITLHVWSPSNYVFDRELGWEGVDFDEAIEELCILTGTVGTEDLKIDVWDSASWTTIATISDADDNTWINTCISAYLTSSTIEVRFLGATESSDSSQSAWEIDTVLIHTSVIPTAIVGSSLANETTIYLRYNYFYTWWLIWNDSKSEIWIEDTTPDSSDTIHVNLVGSPLNGNHTFQFNATDLGSFPVIITLNEPNYQTQKFNLTFIVETNPTQVPVATSSDHEIPKLVDAGSTVLGQYSWIDTNSSQSVPAGNVTVFWNGTPATQADFLQSLDGYYNITINTNEVHWGYYNLTLRFWRYGYENQSLSVFIDIEGLAVYLILDIPEYLVRGEDFLLAATLYENQSSSRLMLLQEGDPTLADELIVFTVDVTFDNGTQHPFSQDDRTDIDGIAHFPLSRDVTKHIKSVEGITASYAGSNTNKAIASSAPTPTLPTVISGATETPFMEEIWNFILDNLLFMIVGGIILLAIGSVGGYQLWSYQATIRGHRAINQKMQEIRLLRMVIIRHKDGVPLFSQSVFGVEKDVAQAIAGMSAAIGSFMEGLSAKTIEGAGHTPGSATEFVRMEQRGLHMLQRKGDHTSVIMISEGPLGKFMENNITKLQLEVENRYSKQFARFFTNEQVPESQLKPLVYHHLYLGLLEPLHLNVRKIRAEERSLKSEERRIVRELLAHKELVPMEVLFVDSYLSHLRDRGIPEVAAAQFLLKGYEVGFIEAQSVQEAMRQRPQR